jgi:hypothetical protein
MMRRYELAFLMLLFLTALSSASIWLWTEISHYRASVLNEQTLNGKTPSSEALMNVLSAFPNPQMDFLPGKHLFYESSIAVGAADRPDLPEPARLQWLNQAREVLPAALAREPANSHAWVNLAYTTWLMEGPGQNVIESLRMSIYTAPANTQILLWRLEMAGENRDFWDAGFRDLLSHQIVLAWRYAPKDFTKMAVAVHMDDLVREALSNDPAELARFESFAVKSAHP